MLEKELDEFGGGELAGPKAETGELADKMVAFRDEAVFGFLENIVFVKRQARLFFEAGGKSRFNAELKTGEGNDKIELFIKNLVFLDGFLDKLVIFFKLVFEQDISNLGFLSIK